MPLRGANKFKLHFKHIDPGTLSNFLQSSLSIQYPVTPVAADYGCQWKYPQSLLQESGDSKPICSLPYTIYDVHVFSNMELYDKMPLTLKDMAEQKSIYR